ncbi:MAG: 5'/3'-nucleotidase SurE [Sulfurihydrogenibium sp.]|uniref:5'/3'-nucleotidase SurE n=1 Tax=Sulfurihydrogenibium sp. TaxID=2053621 RepID=UPI003D12D5FE
MKKLIFLTNDDGYQSKGLLSMRETLIKAGFEVVTVTPDRNMSGTSHSLTFTRPLKIVKLEENFYYVADGTPADCVHLGLNVILEGKKPDLLVSGINTGPNIGNDVFYSGTVGAAREGTLFDIPSIAFSVGSSKNPNYPEIAEVGLKIVKAVMLKGLPKGVFLNVNIPTIPKNQIKGFLLTKQGRSAYKEEIVKYLSPSKEEYYWIGGEEALLEECQPGTDYTAVKEGFVSITPIKLDLTDYLAIETLDKENFLSEIMRF